MSCERRKQEPCVRVRVVGSTVVAPVLEAHARREHVGLLVFRHPRQTALCERVERVGRMLKLIGEPATNYSEDAYYYIIYQKGPLFFATLADLYGEAELLAALSEYYDTYRYGIVTPDDLQQSLEASLGEDLDAIFAEWVGSYGVQP